MIEDTAYVILGVGIGMALFWIGYYLGKMDGYEKAKDLYKGP